ncbi:2-aminoadipate transaminase-like [Liolophura sinensis]|uniref:2-aminoadipate transaminase-like n=1 Tax=Liolophura sinensis TaxID=3198878 RepID=UPI0031581133
MAKRADQYLEMIDHHIDEDNSRVMENTIRLVAGSPGFSCFQGVPELLMEATKHCMTSRSDLNAVLSYGNPVGYQKFLDELAKFLTDEYGTKVSCSNLMATGGSTWAITAIARMFVGTSAPVFVSNPTFNGSIMILKDELHLNVIPVQMDDKGIDTGNLEELLEDIFSSVGTDHVTDNRPYWGMVSLISNYDNPTGISLSPERSKRLVDLGRKYNLLVVSDDIYSLLYYTGDKYLPVPRLITYDDSSDPAYQGRVLSIGSFSKLLAPGLRVGWIEGPERVIQLLSSVPSLLGGSVCHYPSSVLASALQLGLVQDHVTRIREIYGSRLKAVMKVLDEQLPAAFSYIAPKGGYFIWIRLLEEVNVSDLCDLCETKFNVSLSPGHAYYLGDKAENCVRITFGYYEEEVLVEGIKRMCGGMREYLSSLASDATS